MLASFQLGRRPLGKALRTRPSRGAAKQAASPSPPDPASAVSAGRARLAVLAGRAGFLAAQRSAALDAPGPR